MTGASPGESPAWAVVLSDAERDEIELAYVGLGSGRPRRGIGTP